ncbi:hypothetical protein [Reyranella sp.]|uniref:hypothetical protein n=1 Tax=Reyranella sp. TaxID=1929291 RepID=UPI003D0CC93D
MSMPAPKWLGRADDGNLRGWLFSLFSILIAALLIVAIAEWAPRPVPVATEEEIRH